MKGIIVANKGKMYCYRVNGYVISEYPSVCKNKMFRVYELKPFEIDNFKLDSGKIIAYDVHGTQLKTWNEEDILEVLQ